MPIPSQIDLMGHIKEGQLELAIRKLSDAAEDYVDRFGLASIKEGYTEVVMIGGRLQEITRMVYDRELSNEASVRERLAIQRSFMALFDRLPKYFWADEPPPAEEKPAVKPPPIPVSQRPQTTDQPVHTPPQGAMSQTASPTGVSFEPAAHVPEQVKPILRKYRPLIFLAELDFAPLDFHRSFEFLQKHLPQVDQQSVIVAFTEKYFWQLSGIVLTNRYLFVKDTFSAQPVWYDYNFIQAIELQPNFPWSITFNRQIAYALGGLKPDQRMYLRSFMEEMVMALRGV